MLYCRKLSINVCCTLCHIRHERYVTGVCASVTPSHTRQNLLRKRLTTLAPAGATSSTIVLRFNGSHAGQNGSTRGV